MASFSRSLSFVSLVTSLMFCQAVYSANDRDGLVEEGKACVDCDVEEPVNLVKIASIDWCPYICADDKKPGVLTEYVQKIFSGLPYELSFTPMPWARAIHETTTGAYHALLSPAKEEAPELIYPERHLGYQHMCFFTRADDEWAYSDLSSLEGRRVVYAYNAYPASLEGARDLATFYAMSYTDDYVDRGFKMVMNGRMDTFLFTYYSSKLYLTENALADRVRVAGCVQRQPVYLAFTPSDASAEKRKALIALVDERIASLEKLNTFETLLAEYGLKPLVLEGR